MGEDTQANNVGGCSDSCKHRQLCVYLRGLGKSSKCIFLKRVGRRGEETGGC